MHREIAEGTILSEVIDVLLALNPKPTQRELDNVLFGDEFEQMAVLDRYLFIPGTNELRPQIQNRFNMSTPTKRYLRALYARTRNSA